MVKYGFKVLKLNRIWGSLDARNVAARIVLQNANMKHEAVLREDKAVEYQCLKQYLAPKNQGVQ